jgi:hypothetical protein
MIFGCGLWPRWADKLQLKAPVRLKYDKFGYPANLKIQENRLF